MTLRNTNVFVRNFSGHITNIIYYLKRERERGKLTEKTAKYRVYTMRFIREPWILVDEHALRHSVLITLRSKILVVKTKKRVYRPRVVNVETRRDIILRFDGMTMPFTIRLC